MKTSLQLNISQQLTLTPQLQQAIRLLQLSTLDLNQEIQQALESNPMLEINGQEHNITVKKKSDISRDDYKDVRIDTSETTHYSSTPSKGRSSKDNFNFEHFYGTSISLQDHLNWQLNLSPLSEIDKAIAMTLIEAINYDGMLSVALEELHLNLMKELDVSREEIESVRQLLMRFEPTGCCAKDLGECLLVQLSQLDKNCPITKLAVKIIKNDLPLLAKKNYRVLMKSYNLDEKSLSDAISLIQTLNPKPGLLIESEKPEYITPDVIVKKVNNEWVVQLNNDSLPKLTINNSYASLIKRSDSSNDNQYLKNNLQEAKWLLKSIESRQDTLLKVACSIVKHQSTFLEEGDEAMRPLILNDVAELLGMHESTISRVTTQKYMLTPKGIYELKFFFSSHVSTSAGGECSSTAIRAIIKKLVAEEDRRKPLSDNKIAALLNEQGISVARRTIAKYRESLGIAASNERKSIVSKS